MLVLIRSDRRSLTIEYASQEQPSLDGYDKATRKGKPQYQPLSGYDKDPRNDLKATDGGYDFCCQIRDQCFLRLPARCVDFRLGSATQRHKWYRTV